MSADDINNLNERQRATLWVFGAIYGLAQMGMIEKAPGAHGLTPSGVSIWDRLDMTWKPSDTQIEDVVGALDDFEECDKPGIILLVQEYRHNRKKMEEWTET